MSSLKKNIATLFILFFLIGAIVTVSTLFTLEGDLVAQSTTLDIGDFTSPPKVFTKLYITVGVTLIAAAIAILLYTDRKNNVEGDSAVYMGRGKTKQNSKQEAATTDTDVKENIDEKTLEPIAEIIKKADTKDEAKTYGKLLSVLCNHLEASQAAIYLKNTHEGVRNVKMAASYAFSIAESQILSYEFGEGLVGQVAKENQLININNVPEDYIQIFSGLGSSTPSNLLIAPITSDNGELYGVLEIASFKTFSKRDEQYIDKVFALVNTKKEGIEGFSSQESLKTDNNDESSDKE